MKKEEQAELISMKKAFDELTESFKRANTQPILFSAPCGRCGNDTVHVSHIARDKPTRMAVTVEDGKSINATLENTHHWLYESSIRTCLVCSLTTFRDYYR